MDHDAFVGAFVANWLATVAAHRYMHNACRFGDGHLRDECGRSEEIILEAEVAWAIYQAGIRKVADRGRRSHASGA